LVIVLLLLLSPMQHTLNECLLRLFAFCVNCIEGMLNTESNTVSKARIIVYTSTVQQ
jgi:hypothetical protein